jgi:SAM-dependent methyltransferase
MGITDKLNRSMAAVLGWLVPGMPSVVRRAVAPYMRRRYTRDRRLAAVAAYVTNPRVSAKEAERLAPLSVRLFDLGYLKWPETLSRDVSDRDVLDIGCGIGAHAVGFILAGARSYTGVDPHMDDRRQGLRNNHSGEWTRLDWSADEIMTWTPRIRLRCADVADLPVEDRFDVAVLHNVTEHVPDLEAVLAPTAEHLRQGGLLIFNHHNFFSWNGHHRPPKTVDQVDAATPEDQAFADWGHVGFKPPPGHMFLRKLNRLRIAEVRAITSRYFDILDWQLIPSTLEQGAGRLTDEIRARYPYLSPQDFLTQHVFCRATPKASLMLCSGSSASAISGSPRAAAS